MKKTIVILIVLFSVNMFLTFAALQPSIGYCLHHGYERDNAGNCVFSDGEKCDLDEFFNGSCGQDYLMDESDIPCRQEGDNLYWHTEKCCEGLSRVDKLGPSSCEKLNLLERFLYWLGSLF